MSEDSFVCVQCGELKPRSAFRPNPRMKRGLHSWCRDCCRKKGREWKRANPERLEVYNARRRKQPETKVCPENGHPSCLGSFETVNPLQTYCSRGCTDRAYAKRLGETGWETRLRQAFARGGAAEVERVRAMHVANVRRRDSRIAAGERDSITLEALAERDGWRCVRCGKRVSRKAWSIDHLVPLVYGGSHTWDNVAIAHRSCNSAAQARAAAQLLLPMVADPTEVY